MMLQNITKTYSQALLQEAMSKREQAEKTQFLTDMLKRAGGQEESASVIAQVQQLNLDVQRLLESASRSEFQAKEMLKQNAALQLGDTAKTCSPVANKMSSDEILSASHLNANLSDPSSSTRKELLASQLSATPPEAVSPPAQEQVSWHFGFRGAALNEKANVSLAGFKDQGAPPPTNSDFGMDKVNPKGKLGIQSGQCTAKDNCNFRGICQDGVCYCQKNYYGPTCGTLREKKTGSVRLAAVGVIAVGCTLFSFLFTLFCLNWTAMKRRHAESKLGYVV